MIHTLRSFHQPILQIPTNIPHHHDDFSYRKQPIPTIHRLRRSGYHIIPSHRVVTRTNRCKYSRPPGSPLQSHWRCRFYHSHSMILNQPKHMGTSTDLYFPPQQPKHTTYRPPPSSNWEISSIRTSPMTAFSHRRTYPSIRPTPFKYHGRSRSFPPNSISPPNRT